MPAKNTAMRRFRGWLIDFWYYTIRGHVLSSAERLKGGHYRYQCSCGGVTLAYASRRYGVSWVVESTCAYGLAYKRMHELPPARVVRR